MQRIAQPLSRTLYRSPHIFRSTFTPHTSRKTTTMTNNPPSSTTATTTTNEPLPTPQSILDFWFSGTTTLQGWFTANPAFDARISQSYTALVAAARTGSLTPTWTTTAHSTLALLLCLDQFPRNMFRGRPEAFASDAQAREIAALGIAKGFDREVSLVQAGFFYIPFEHGEDMVSQSAGVALFEGLIRRVDDEVDVCKREGGSALSEEEVGYVRYGLTAAREHRDVIVKFGRFPGRNATLGRESTAGEVRHLKEFGSW